MTRQEIVFEINYSYYLEKMYSTLTGRIDRFLSLLVFFLGASVFAQFKGSMFYGALVALITAISYIYQFGKTSAYADDRAKEYLKLIRTESLISDDNELREKFQALEDVDSKIWSVLEYAARQRAIVALGLKDETPTELSAWQWIVSFIAGGVPNQKDYLINHTQKSSNSVDSVVKEQDKH